MINCPDNNYMLKKNINTENYYQNRRDIKTTLSKSDFDISYDEFEISCTELLSDHLFCNICFNSNENSLTNLTMEENLISKKIYHLLKSQMNV